MSDLEKISQIVKESFGIPLNRVEKEGLLSSEKVLVMLFDNTGEMQFAIVEGANPFFTKDNIEHDTKKREVKK